jgi:subtilisin family serine protease
MNKWFLILILLLIFTGFVFSSKINNPYGNSSDKIDNKIYERFNLGEEKVKVIVQLNDKITNSTRIIEQLKKEKARHIFSSSNSFSIELTKQNIEELEKNEEIKGIYFDYPMKTFLQESVPLINASETWDLQIEGLNLNGSGQSICIIDTGVDFTHPDLTGKNLTCNIDCYNKSCVENCSVLDDNGHGTHVAGITGALGGINGTAIGVNLIGIKALNSNGDGSISNVIAGIEWCIDYSEEYNISGITMSLGGEELYNEYCDNIFGFALIRNAINSATLNNISITIATGNDGNASSISLPACIQNAIRVSSTTKADVISLFSNHWALDILFAPGTLINSTYIPPLNYKTDSGTSMATPHVAGAITIINQLLQLTNRTMTPKQIENALYLTGENISADERYYSRIDVYFAVLSLDNIAPEVNLISPEDNKITTYTNQSFTCNASDWQLKNTTLKIWNSTGLYFNETKNTSGIYNETNFSVTDLSSGEYEWDCFVYDEKNNLGYSSSNFSVFIGEISIELFFPENDTYTNVNETNFTCKIYSDENYELKNASFFLWNFTRDLINISTEIISGTYNETNFTYTFENQGNYSWNCMAFNNESKSYLGEYNYTITFDTTPPLLTDLITTAGSSSATITWETNELANSSSNLGGGSSEFTTTHSIPLSGLSPYNTYNFIVTSCDKAENCASKEGSFTTSSSVIRLSSTGGGSSVTSVTELKESNPASKNIAINESFIFKINNSQHTLKVLEITENKARILIESSPIYIILSVGEEKKLNLSSEDYYDLLVKLESIVSGRANITIKNIYEKIETYEEPEEPIFAIKTKEESSPNSNLDFLEKVLLQIIILFVITSLIILIGRKIIKREKINKNDEREKIKTKALSKR